MTPEKGYYELKYKEYRKNLSIDGIKLNNDMIEVEKSQWLHFSANCWAIMEKESGLTVGQLLVEIGEELSSEDEISQLIILDLMTELVYAAAKAYDGEEGIISTYTKMKVRDWVAELSEEESMSMYSAIIRNTSIKELEKKLKREKSPQSSKLFGSLKATASESSEWIRRSFGKAP